MKTVSLKILAPIIQRKQILEQKLEKESNIVKRDSMSVLKDFEEIDYID